MSRLNELVEQQVRRYLDVSEEEFEYLRHPSPEHLHDPFYYKDMRELVMALHQFKLKQEKDPSLLLMINGDYDTDGVLATTILVASLSVFGFQYRAYIPTMEDGYGLSKTAVDKMKAGHETEGKKIGMILTADNGINAFSGVSYAKAKGIEVLITDHHPSEGKLPNAKAVVDANRPGDLYPFKGNSGACVAWKTMLAYAELFAKDKKPLIEQLIVFAGMSNVADVMPIRNENRYTVTAAVKKINEIRLAKSYQEIVDTPYKEYNTVFYALFDLIIMLQASKDEKRKQEGKKGVPLPDTEEIISWYLSPLINAPRRVHDTCLESLSIFLVTDEKTRKFIIKRLIELNEEKSKLRDAVLNALPPNANQCVVCANTRKGISGLIAGKLTEESGLPAFVFSKLDPNYPDNVYQEVPTNGYISGSGRSNVTCPVNRVIKKINTFIPGLITSGGGHATAAGITIEAKNYKLFEETLQQVIPIVQAEMLEEEVVSIVPENSITLTIHPASIMAEYQKMENGTIITEERALEINSFAGDVERIVKFFESLRPFGEQFEPETKFKLLFDHTVYNFNWNPDFWSGKTFKFNLFGVEVLTFNETWAKEVKELLSKNCMITAYGKLKLNEFRGDITPQIILDTE